MSEDCHDSNNWISYCTTVEMLTSPVMPLLVEYKRVDELQKERETTDVVAFLMREFAVRCPHCGNELRKQKHESLTQDVQPTDGVMLRTEAL